MLRMSYSLVQWIPHILLLLACKPEMTQSGHKYASQYLMLLQMSTKLSNKRQVVDMKRIG